MVESRFFNSTSKFFDPRAPRKSSFAPLLRGSPHTLLMGTQASDNALDAGKVFATNENAFWHIVGDALGFRRGFHLKREDAVPSIQLHLLHPPSSALEYDAAVDRLLDAGFAVWDIVGESERGGSLDQDIRKPRFHDVRSLCAEHPSIHRICFATGEGSAKIFRGAWKEWLATPGAFRAAPDAISQRVFARYLRDGDPADVCAVQPVELMVMESVSPAAVPAVATRCPKRRIAAYLADGREDLVAAGAPRAAGYAWKRARWMETCFADVLHENARAALPFGRRPNDLLESTDARSET